MSVDGRDSASIQNGFAVGLDGGCGEEKQPSDSQHHGHLFSGSPLHERRLPKRFVFEDVFVFYFVYSLHLLLLSYHSPQIIVAFRAAPWQKQKQNGFVPPPPRLTPLDFCRALDSALAQLAGFYRTSAFCSRSRAFRFRLSVTEIRRKRTRVILFSGTRTPELPSKRDITTVRVTG